MISLAGHTLCEYLQIPDWYSSPWGAGSARPTLGGRLVVQRGQAATRRITLTARQDGRQIRGYYTRTDVEFLRGLAESGETVELVYHSHTAQVVVSLDGFAPEMVDTRSNPRPEDLYVGTIALMQLR